MPLDPNAPRLKKLGFKVNDHEEEVIFSYLRGITPERAPEFAIEIAQRLARRGPFENLAELIRAIFDLDNTYVGAPKGNKNRFFNPDRD